MQGLEKGPSCRSMACGAGIDHLLRQVVDHNLWSRTTLDPKQQPVIYTKESHPSENFPARMKWKHLESIHERRLGRFIDTEPVDKTTDGESNGKGTWACMRVVRGVKEL